MDDDKTLKDMVYELLSQSEMFKFLEPYKKMYVADRLSIVILVSDADDPFTGEDIDGYLDRFLQEAKELNGSEQ